MLSVLWLHNMTCEAGVCCVHTRLTGRIMLFSECVQLVHIL